LTACSFRIAVLAAFFGFLLAPVVQAGETGIEVLRQGTPHESLFDVVIQGTRGLAIGDLGEVLVSDDGGRTWRRTNSEPGDLAFLGAVLTGEQGLIVGQAGTILRRTSEGWRSVDSGTDQRLFAVDINRRGLAVAVGGFGALLRSDDGGESWTPVTLDWHRILDDVIEPHLYDVHVDDRGTVTVVGEFGLVIRSDDGARSWQVVRKGTSSIFALSMTDDGEGLAVGQDGLVLQSADGGVTWTRVPVPVKANFLDILATGDGTVFISGIRTMIRSRDHMQSWEALTAGDLATGWYQKLARGPNQEVIAVGHLGRIIRLPADIEGKQLPNGRRD